jgi:hypothetical protein
MTTVIGVDVGTRNLGLCMIRRSAGRDGFVGITNWKVISCLPTSLHPRTVSASDVADALLAEGVGAWVESSAAATVVIERQPRKNPSMTRMQHYLEMFFALRGAKNIYVQDAKRKLAFAASSPWWWEPGDIQKKKWTYRDRKKMAVRTVEAFLNTSPKDVIDPEWKSFFEKSRKKDDLADSLLHAMAFCTTTKPPSTTTFRIARAPTAKQLSSGALSPSNVAWYLKACGTPEDVEQRASENAALRRAISRHFGTPEGFLSAREHRQRSTTGC